ncbi:APC family permease [Cellulomonas sp. SG140]|uniref:APC family permease n=1 Tax=Cellulomonas sp. SG140 TaxID=2976536 RepID=UPI0021E7E2E7|nr:amino acid permease [Cellulomonas sp. SG140]
MTDGTIGLAHGVALYSCAVLGAGVLVLPGQAASLAGPASLVAWGFSALLGLALAFTFAALAVRHPDAGGVATFTAAAFGPTLGGVTGWWYLVAGSVGQTVVALTAGYYVTAAVGVSQRWSPAVAAVVLACAVVVNLRGLRTGARVQVALALGVAAILVTVVLVALPQVHRAELTPFAPASVGGVGRAVVVLFFAFAGWEAVAHLSGEFRDVRRTLPAATLITVVVVTVLYLGVALAVVGTRAYGTPDLDRIALGTVLQRGLGLSALHVVAVAAVVICVGTINAYVASVSRLGYALARDGWAPAALERRNRHGAPANAILVVAGIGTVGLAGAALLGWGTGGIVVIPSVLVLATYLVASAAAVRLLTGARRLVAVVAVVLLLLAVPYVGRGLAIPLLVAAVAAVVHRARRRPDGAAGRVSAR